MGWIHNNKERKISKTLSEAPFAVLSGCHAAQNATKFSGAWYNTCCVEVSYIRDNGENVLKNRFFAPSCGSVLWMWEFRYQLSKSKLNVSVLKKTAFGGVKTSNKPKVERVCAVENVAVVCLSKSNSGLNLEIPPVLEICEVKSTTRGQALTGFGNSTKPYLCRTYCTHCRNMMNHLAVFCEYLAPNLIYTIR